MCPVVDFLFGFVARLLYAPVAFLDLAFVTTAGPTQRGGRTSLKSRDRERHTHQPQQQQQQQQKRQQPVAFLKHSPVSFCARRGEIDRVDDVEHEREGSGGVDAVGLYLGVEKAQTNAKQERRHGGG